MNDANQLIPLVAEDSVLSITPKPATNSSRRDAIKQLALFCGLALSASSLSALAALAPTDMKRSKKTLLDQNQLGLLRELGEIIIPTTDTPGAIAAGVHDFVNHFTVYCASKEEQQTLLATLSRINAAGNKPFIMLSQEQQIEILNNMEQAKNGFTQQDRNGFKHLKSLIAFGYYTSEIGASQELAYLAIPGGYKGNFKFKEIGKAWALSN